MTTRRRKKHRPEEVVAKLRDADAMLNAGKDLAAVLQALEISESTLERWRAGHRREAVVVELRTKCGVSERRACTVVDQPRSSQRFEAKPRTDAAPLVKRMLQFSSRNLENTGTGIMECLRRITRCGRLSPRWRSGMSKSSGIQRPVGMGVTVTARKAVAMRTKSPAPTTRPGSRGRN
jgi:hypothetical protein